MPGSGRPNILLLHVDEQPWNALAVEGNAHVRTPSIDRLATQGCRFAYCFTQHLDPVLARVALMSGQYPSRTCSGAHLDSSPTLLPRLLSAYGYRSAGFGSMRLTAIERDWRKPYPNFGFDQLEVSDGFGRDDAFGSLLRSRHSDATERVAAGLAQDERTGTQIFPLAPDSTPNALVAARTLSFLQQQARTGQPFFCMAGLRAFSWPLVMPQRFLALYDAQHLPLPDISPYLRQSLGLSDEQIRFKQRAYYATISEIDHHVGFILQDLERLHLAQNTIVVYTASRGLYADAVLKNSGTWIPDDMARVPLIVRGPADMVMSEVLCNSMVESVDIVPTLLDLVGISMPPDVQGKSFAPILAGESRVHRETAMTEMADRRALRTRYFQYVVRTDGLEAMFDLSQGKNKFTDLSTDLRYRGTIADQRYQLILRMLQASLPVPA